MVVKILLFSLLLLLPSTLFAQFTIRSAQTHFTAGVHSLDATIDYGLSNEAKEALNSGIILTIELSIVVQQERWYLWNKTVAALNQRYQLKYQALTDEYVIKNLNTGIQDTFPNLPAALTALGQIVDFPLLDKHLVKADYAYQVYLQTYLDIEALPVPLRPAAYFSRQWRLASDWYSCPLEPVK
ncbi:MAG: hypothetical protein BWK79_03570 [Beggiatoa sp. IS2]|nr:MAG: hypothetical protein BWK79_03570 [Beggiatoa sp. IS2]